MTIWSMITPPTQDESRLMTRAIDGKDTDPARLFSKDWTSYGPK